ncbi:MAG: dienelactone hydrolase family protein [Oceanospirillaceae bacterium]|nr:dienelactone hydrolase family protein [Oceanospirillaceae bacterium]
MKVRTIFFSGLMLLFGGSFAWADDYVGVQNFDVFSSLRGKNLAITVWYPSDKNGQRIQVGNTQIFKGVSAIENALPTKGSHPLVVLSHGSGSNIQSMAWLATSLAKAGFIVAGPNHPRTTTGDSTPEDTPKLWERTHDLSTLISFLTSDDKWHEYVDVNRIGVIGFSLGGAAAMEIAGARADLDDYVHYCEKFPTMADCHWFASGQAYIDGRPVKVDAFDLRQVDRALFEQSNRDVRIKSAVLVDPSVAMAFNKQSLEDIHIPMTFINLGRPETVPVSVAAKTLAKEAPQGTIVNVNDAVHFSFLPECQNSAKAFLKKIGEIDPLCEDGGTRARADIHAELESLIETSLLQMLK